MLAGVRAMARYPGVRAAWIATRHQHAGRFGDFMDGVVDRAGSPEPLNQYPSVDEWRATYAAEAATG
jgi:hypothetical protein